MFSVDKDTEGRAGGRDNENAPKACGVQGLRGGVSHGIEISSHKRAPVYVELG